MMPVPSDGAGYKGLPANGERASVRRLMIGTWGRHDTGWPKLLGQEDSCHSSKLAVQTLRSKAAQLFHTFLIFPYSNQILLGSGSPDTMGQVTVRAKPM